MRDTPKVHSHDHHLQQQTDLLLQLLSGRAIYDPEWRARSRESARQGDSPIEVSVPGQKDQDTVTVWCALEVEETAANSRALGHLLASDGTAACVKAAMVNVTYRLVPEDWEAAVVTNDSLCL